MRLPLLLALVTATASAQFTLQPSNSTESFRGIHAVNDQIAWASGTGGTVLRTVDGGEHWLACAIPPDAEKLDFRGVQAFDEKTAIVMSSGKGDASRLYKTTDGCKTWKLVFTNPDKDGFWDALQFLSISNVTNHALAVQYARGILLGDPVNGEFAIFQTGDGGDHWIRRTALKRGKESRCRIDTFAAAQGESLFAASNQSLVSPHPYLFFFVTGGSKARLAYVDHFDLDFSFCHESAKYVDLPLGDGSNSSGSFAVATKGRFAAPLEVMAVGGDYKKPDATEKNAVLLRPRGSVHSLFPHKVEMITPTTPPHGYRSSVAWSEDLKAFLTVGPNGTDVSYDNGSTWKPAGTDPEKSNNWNALSLPFAVGPKGRIGKLDRSAFP